MTARHTKTIVPYTAAQMFDLVADIERYPDFLPWCVALRIVDDNYDGASGEMTADMVVAYKVFRERFKSRVTLDKSAGAIDSEYVDGPFRTLQNRWRFTDRADGGSDVDFLIRFEFRNFLLQATAMQVFEKAFARMSGAFIERARVVYRD